MESVTPRDEYPPHDSLMDPDLMSAMPSWAGGVLRSPELAGQHVDTPREQIAAQRDADTGLQFISVQGFHAVAVDPPNNASAVAAVKLLIRLRQSRPLDVGALAFGNNVRVSVKSINQLAGIGVIVSRIHAETALEQAKAAASQYLELQRQAHGHLLKFRVSLK